MFGLSMSELLVIGVVFVLFLKPEDLPKLARVMGKIYHQLNSAYRQLIRDLNSLS
ncbi:hypothetical protein HOH87_01495 [bacterium]|jgi:Sec-independent protein translocase protein TatA|nr:hypothetical protein [bacterium]